MSRRRPFEEIEDVFQRMNRELESLSEQFSGQFRGGPNVDVIEYDDHVTVQADLPGYTADEIDVSLAGRDLTIAAGQDDEPVEVDAGHAESSTDEPDVEADVGETDAEADTNETSEDTSEPSVTTHTDGHDESADTEEGHYHRRERHTGPVQRRVRLPMEVRDDGVEASYEQGVLTVSFPIHTTTAGTEIEVN